MHRAPENQRPLQQGEGIGGATGQRMIPVTYGVGRAWGKTGASAGNYLRNDTTESARTPHGPKRPQIAQPAVPDSDSQFVEIDGWRTLKWGDSVEDVKRKLKDVGLSRCIRVSSKKEKGRIMQAYSCHPSSKEATGLRYVSLIYLDERLQRVAPTYRMTTGTAAVDNLEKALANRYCPLTGSLTGALTQLKLGNVGQTQQIQFGCEQSKGDIFMVLKAVEEEGEFFSEIVIVLSSNDYQAFQRQNEFNNAF